MVPMQRLLILLLFGLFAQLVDGALGMAYGATSTSLLLVAGLAPAAASASVHLAEVGTTLVAGTAHWRFGNVDWGIVARIGVPGAAGAFLGATVLSSLSTEAARPVTAGILLAIGVWLLVRFGTRTPRSVAGDAPHGLKARFLAPLGLVAGFIDATGGGGWGPVATPSLLVTERVEPRRVIGTVDTAEFLVTVAASLGFLLGLGRAGFDGRAVTALLAGGLVAAPLAAWLVTRIPPAMLGASVGGLLVLTNLHALLGGRLSGPVMATLDVVVAVAWFIALLAAHRRHRRERGDDVDVVVGMPDDQPDRPRRPVG